MTEEPGRPYSVAVVPSETDPGCYDWVIHAQDGSCVARSPYALATEAAARLSGESWRREVESERSTA